MNDTITKGFPTDERFTPEFVKDRGVRLSVEIDCHDEGGADAVDRPGFFFWNDDGAVFLVDFNDGFSPALSDTLDVAMAMVESTGVPLAGKTVHWRDPDKTWRTLSPQQVDALLTMTRAIAPGAA